MSIEKVKPNPADYGMIGVTRESFFATVGQLNVHPCPEGRWDDTLGYLSRWKWHGGAGDTVGATVGGTTFSEKCYMVTRAFYEKNQAALELA